MKITNHANLPSAIVEAVRNDPYSPGKSDITVTQLISPPQIVELTRRHWDELEEDAADRLWSLMGQVAHGILERAEVSALTETRLYADMNGWTVGGQFDRLVLLPDGLLQDYKVCSVYEVIFGLKPERVQQLNVLRWLAEKNGYTINGLEIVSIFRDWSKTKAERERGFPPQQVSRIPLTMWPMDDAERFVAERVAIHQQARAGEIPPCSDDDRWARPDKWAVMRKGRKSAVRVFDSKQEAQSRIEELKGDHIEHRPGENVRCKHYCAVADICPQYARIKEST